MVRIEDLTAGGSSENLPFPLGRNALTNDGIAPALPPAMQSVRSHTADEIVQMMNKTPLFMTSLENTGGEDGQNLELEAIRALQYEGSPSENAQNFKEQGNEQVKAKRWTDAKEFYTKGLATLFKKLGSHSETHGNESTMSQEEEDTEAQRSKDVEEACYVNRALCNLELKNYRSTTLDCAAALRLNARNVKAYYRSSQALLALDKLAEASDSCTRGLVIDPINRSLKELSKKIKAREDAVATLQQRRQQEAARAQKEKAALSAALRARNICIRTTVQPPDMEDALIHLAPDPLAPTSTLNFPVVLLYPLHAQSDFIKAFSEMDTVPQHLDYIFPLPWDKEKEYQIPKVEYYMETREGGLIKVGKNISLLKMLSSDSVEVVDGIVKINVVPKNRAGAWIEEMKMRKGKP